MPPLALRSLHHPLHVAVFGLLLAFGAQAFLVYGLYGGDWRGLYYTGSGVVLPPAIAAEDPPRSPDPTGFDGQFYHVAAHSPLPPADAAQYMDNPRLRWRRILAPGLAHAVSRVIPGAVDPAYVGVLLAFTFCGVWWSAGMVAANGLPAWVGLCFLLLPATMISLERLTVDVALAALCAGFAMAAGGRAGPGLYVLLALAPLARETGVALAGAWGIAQLASKRVGAAALAGLTLLPFAGWAWMVQSRTPPDATSWFGSVPLGGLLARTVTLFPEPAPGLGLKLAAGLDYLALLGVWAAIALAAVELKRAPREPLALAAALTLAIFVFLAKEDIWSQSYGFARTLSPTFLLLALLGMKRRNVLLAAPFALTVPRMAYQVLLLVLSVVRS